MLKKKISILNGIAIAISMVVGSGLFGLPGLAIKATDPLTALLGWGIVICIMPTLLYVFSYLGQRYPSSEGLSLYANIGLGAWSKKGVMLVTCGTLLVGMPAFFLVGGSYITKFLSLDPEIWVIPSAIALAILTTLINIAGLEKLGFINKIVVTMVLVTVFFISFRSLPMAFDGYKKLELSAFHSVTFTGVWLSASIVFWAFQGWENLTFGFGEIENPQRNIPLIFWLSFIFVAFIYGIFSAVITAAALKGMDVAGLAGIASVLPADRIGQILLAIMVLILVANANAWVYGSSRAYYSAAVAGLLPKAIGTTNKHGIPVYSLSLALLIYISVILVTYIFHLNEEYMFLMTTQGFILLYGGAIFAFFKLSSGFLHRFIGVVALVGWSFLMQGFGWMIIYPLILLSIGFFLQRCQASQVRA